MGGWFAGCRLDFMFGLLCAGVFALAIGGCAICVRLCCVVVGFGFDWFWGIWQLVGW